MSTLEIIKNNTLRAEFLRAADLITQTQVTMFLDRPAPDKPGIIETLETQLEESGQGDDETVQISTMRQLLSDTLDIYNDPFANYITPKQLKNYYARRGGNLMGIGVKYRAFDEDYPVIIGVLLGGPLEKSGIKPGDRITAIDGVDQEGASSADVSGKLKGDEGSTVQLSMQHRDGGSFEVTATRSKVTLRYARAELMDDQIGYIKVSRFGGKTHETVAAMVSNLIGEGAKGMVLDLRDNPGGSTRAARGIVSIFTDKQSVYCEQYKTGATRELPRHGNKLTDMPLVLLINGKSMSSSEIVAGALQDYQRATLIGEPSYGKGLIQKVFNMKAPLGGAVRTTIAAYATPAQTLIHGVGVTPDIFIESAPRGLFAETGSLNISNSAREFKRELLEKRLREDLDPEEAENLISLQDTQLNQGLAELKTLIESN